MKIPGFSRYGTDEIVLISIGSAVVAACVWVLADSLDWPLLRIALVFPLAVWGIGMWFFRDPRRIVPDDPDILVSPADGVVQDILEIDADQMPGGRARRLGIFMSPLNVHVNRAPCAGEIVSSEYRAGECIAAFHEDACERNERHTIVLRLDDGEDDETVEVRQITGALARKIVCNATVGQRYRRGQRYGMIKFGSRVEVWIAAGSRFEWCVTVNQKVTAGTTIIARRKPLSTQESPSASPAVETGSDLTGDLA